MAQDGLWDLDDTGLVPVPDANLAKALLDRVNALNLEIAVKACVPVVFFAVLPQSSAVSLVVFSWLFAALYVARDKIPSNP